VEQKKDKKGLFVGGCGGCLTLLCLASAAFWGWKVAEDSGGISADEAMPGLLGSCCCALISIAIVGVGIFLAVRANKQPQ
jgi:hypothetical protein